MKLILWLHFIYLCSKARVSAKGINLRIKILQHENVDIKYVGLVVKSPKTNSYVQLSGMSESSFNLALKKAFSEFLESYTYWKNELDIEESRSGMATHKNYEQCYQNAYQELIERDSFIMHLYSPELKTDLLPSSDGIDFIKLQSIDSEVSVVLARGFNDNKQFISLAASDSVGSALKKAKMELIMLFNEAPDFGVDGKDLVLDCLLPHYLSSQSLATSEIIDHLFSGGGNQILAQIDSGKVRITIQENFGSFITLKLTSDDVLNLKFGKSWENEYKNHFRILTARGLEASPYLIHPLL